MAEPKPDLAERLRQEAELDQITSAEEMGHQAYVEKHDIDTTAEAQTRRALKGAVEYTGPAIGETVGSTLGGTLGTAFSKTIVRHATVAVASVVVTTGVVAAVFGGKVILRAFGPVIAGIGVANILSATGLIVAGLWHNHKASK